jgi:hypothetical protein
MSDPIELLKTWHDRKTPVVASQGDNFARGPSFWDNRVLVQFVDGTRLVLSTIEDQPQTKTLDLREVTLSVLENGVKVMWPDGKAVPLIPEE